MVELGEPIKGGKEVIWRQRLELSNGWAASTVGHGFYYDNNPKASYGDALETCKSDALARACKDLNMGIQLLERRYKELWKLEHCVLVWRCRELMCAWRRKDALPFEDEGHPDKSHLEDYTRKQDYYDEARQHWAELTSKRPDDLRLERAEKEAWVQSGAAPWDDMEDLRRLAVEDELFGSDARED